MCSGSNQGHKYTWRCCCGFTGDKWTFNLVKQNACVANATSFLSVLSPVTITFSPLEVKHQMDHNSDTHQQQPSEVKSGHVEDESLLPDRKETRRLLFKIDLRIIPFIALLYICSFLDRVNIANAKVAGLVEDLGMSDDMYNWAVSIFFISYVSYCDGYLSRWLH